MTNVGIIGSGMIGGTVARLSVAARHNVVLSNSRGPETLAELVAELGPLAAAGTAEQAAEAGDIVVVSIPVKAFGDVPVKPLAGKPALDTGNYYPRRDGQIAELDTGALAGPIAESWRQEPGTPAYGTPYGPFTDEAGTPASAAKIRADLIGAHR